MVVVDTSAVVAILREEEDASGLVDVLDQTDGSYMSAVSYVETTMVIIGRRTKPDRKQIDVLIESLGIEVAPVTLDQSAAAVAAFLSYGKGRHPASLNIADCFTYALAKTRGLPLLFKGDDFVKTDIVPARQP